MIRCVYRDRSVFLGLVSARTHNVKVPSSSLGWPTYKKIKMKTKDKNIVHNMIIGSQRKRQVEQGFFDGRFVARVYEGDKFYTRKEKHKKKHLVD